MRPDRRSTLAGVALIGVAALLVFDPLGVRRTIECWFAVTTAASGPTRAMATTIQQRSATVDQLAAALATDPLLSLALLTAGLGVGLIAGSAAAFLHQRRRLRRGERDA